MSVDQWLGLGTGVLFGFFLQKGRVLRFEKQIGAMLLKDMTILKFMLSAILVGMVEDPSLDPLIVEQARNVYLEVLLDGKKLDQAETLIAKWPTATGVLERDDRAKLEQRLASLRAGTGRTKNVDAAGQGAGPDKRPSR